MTRFTRNTVWVSATFLSALCAQTSAIAAPVAAKPADSFVASVGVHNNLNMDTARNQLLVDSGIRVVRGNPESQSHFDNLAWLNARGVKALVAIQPGTSVRPDSTFWGKPSSINNNQPWNIVDYVKKIGVSNVVAVEMNNEVNGTDGHRQFKWHPNDTENISADPNSPLYWKNYLLAATPATHNALKADPATQNLPLLGPSIVAIGANGGIGGDYAVLGDLSPWIDYSNIHHYMAGRHPETGGWGDNGYGSIQWTINQCSARQNAANPYAVAATEGGNSTASPYAADKQWDLTSHGKYIPRYYLSHFNAGYKWTVVYRFEDFSTGSTDSEENYGLIKSDGTPKPAYNALKNLLNLLKDPGPDFTPSALDYTFSGNTNGVQTTLLQKRNGKFYLALWQAKLSWQWRESGYTAGPITIPTQNVNIALPAHIGSATWHSLDDNGILTSTSATISGGSIANLPITDRVSVLELTPSGPAATQNPANGGFETPALAANAHAYNPGGATWSFTGNSGISRNGSAFGSTAPEGVQVAFLQTNAAQGAVGAFSQNFNPGVGRYQISFRAARRSGQAQNVRVSVGSTVVRNVTPSGNTFQTVLTDAFTLGTSGATVKFEATATSGDLTAFVDDVKLVPLFANGGFERPALAANSHAYNIGASDWNFEGQAGIARNGSPFNNPTAPEGVQVAFLQTFANSNSGNGLNGRISQFINPGAGSYTISLKAARRSGQAQTVKISVGGTVVKTFVPVDNTFQTVTSDVFTLSSAGALLKLEATTPTTSGDVSAFVDDVQLVPAINLSAGLVGWWKMDESSGTVAADSSGSAKNGTTSGTTWNPSSGKIGGAVTFSGSSAKITLPDNAIRGVGTTQTLAGWFKTSSSGVLLGIQNTTHPTNPTNYTPIVYIGTDGKLRGQIYNGGANTIASSGVVNNGAWHHFALVASGSSQSLYLNGALVGTLSGTLSFETSSKNQFGLGFTNVWPQTNNSWMPYAGWLDDVRQYNRALSPSEVAALAAS